MAYPADYTANSYSHCPGCGSQLFGGLGHACTIAAAAAVTSITSRLLPGMIWNGPICHKCNRGYLGAHDCDAVAIPCPDGRDDCTITHYGHKQKDPA